MKDMCVECNIIDKEEEFSRTFTQKNQIKRKESFRSQVVPDEKQSDK